MNAMIQTTAAPPASAPPTDPFYLGWRWIRHPGDDETADGYEQVPLTPDDLLFPQEEDFVVETAAHDRDCHNLKCWLLAWSADQADVLVLRDARVDFGIEGQLPLGPDISVFRHVRSWDFHQGTFRVAEVGASSLLVVEVTSPSTRNIDLDEKVVEYHRAGVPYYVIVDYRQHPTEGRQVRLLGYQATPAGYVRMPLDERGRLWLPDMQIWLAIEDGKLVGYDKNNVRLKDYPEEVQARREAEQRAEKEKQRAEKEKQRAEKAEKKLAEERRGRKALEDRLRAAEGKPRQRRGKQAPPEP